MKIYTNQSYYQRKRFWAGSLLAQFLLFFIFSKTEITVRLFERFFEWQKSLHQKIFAHTPFSVGDVAYILLAIIFIFFLIKILSKKTRNAYLFKSVILLNILYFIYQLFWGMLYFQEPIINKLPKEEITLQETKALTVKYLKYCKQLRLLVKEDKDGVFKVEDLESVKQEILKQQRRLPGFPDPKSSNGINSLKPSLFTGIMSYTGILGYYNPFTAEAQYNAELPSTYLPFTFAHESAHQLGYAREQEANFIAYLVGKHSGNKELNYSTSYFVLKSLLNSLAEKNPEFVAQIINEYSPAMKRDRNAEKKFVQEHKGFLDTFFGFTNDLFLKTNQQDGSVTYSYFVDLMVRYERNSN